MIIILYDEKIQSETKNDETSWRQKCDITVVECLLLACLIQQVSPLTITWTSAEWLFVIFIMNTHGAAKQSAQKERRWKLSSLSLSL